MRSEKLQASLILAEVQKQASEGFDWQGLLDKSLQFAKDNPWAVGALGGAALGGLTGLGSDEPGSVLRNAVIGGTLGAGLGYAAPGIKDTVDNWTHDASRRASLNDWIDRISPQGNYTPSWMVR